ncbi:MAG: LysR family transcriptional regulator [Betaproteobacteria bacterium]|jgi:DNA-binding transcriptional LysR family regulator|nr:LysR family transcriptional regulator [Betaproteobacteria bacterium]NBT09651.1 LysR family transcriptional regulator [Betaproteobacteria bacterium]NBU49309.1 LysR family transcriptional regulator [Betaproteobacteria bacterium]NBX95795.1 LysR family transcriptional regulator [Betaproteobacteria bacterium]
MLPDLDSLALFVRAAEMRNLTRAAEASFITVPAASRRLSLLEHQFKAQLFERHSRGLELTPAGEQLMLLAREVIATVNHMRAEMANYTQGSRSVLRIHGNTSAMTQFLPADVASFQQAHPDVRIVLEECWSEDAIKRVRGGEIELGVIVEGADVSGLHVQPYRGDQLAAVVREDDAVPTDGLTFADLLDRDLIGLEGTSTLTRLLADQAALMMRAMVLRVQVRSFEAVCRAVEARLGVGVLPMTAARSFAPAMQLKVLPLQDEWAMRRMSLVTRTEPAPGSPLGQLVAHLAGCARS